MGTCLHVLIHHYISMKRGRARQLVKFNWKRSDQSVSNSFLTRRILRFYYVFCARPLRPHARPQARPPFLLRFPRAASAAPGAAPGAASVSITFSTRGLCGPTRGPWCGLRFYYVFHTRPLWPHARPQVRPPFLLRFPRAASAAPGAAPGAASVSITFSTRGLSTPFGIYIIICRWGGAGCGL